MLTLLGQVYAKEGEVGQEFLLLNPGARASALAGSYAALGQDAESLFYNPAGILHLVNPQIGFSHLAWWESVSYDAFWGVQPWGKDQAFGLTAAWLNVPPFNSTDDPTIASEAAWNCLLTGTYAFQAWSQIAAGIQLKLLGSALGDSHSWGAAVDAGAQYELFDRQLVLAASLQNLGGMSAFMENGDPLPVRFLVAAALNLWPEAEHRASLTADLGWTYPQQGTLKLGAEGWLWNTLALRLGMRTGQAAGDWLSFGTGVHWRALHVDYALSPYGFLGMTQQVSLSYDFGSQVRSAKPGLEVVAMRRELVRPDGRSGYELLFMPRAWASAGIAHWELGIFDGSGLQQSLNGSGPTPVSWVWDGRTEQGTPRDLTGVFTYQAVVHDGLGGSATALGRIPAVENVPLAEWAAVPRDLKPEQTGFSPHLKSPIVTWSVELVGPDGEIARKYQGTGALPKEYVWHEEDQDAAQLIAKNGYHYVVKVQDEQHHETASVVPQIEAVAGSKAVTDTDLRLDDKVPVRFKITANFQLSHWALDVVEKDTQNVVRQFSGKEPLPEALLWNSRDQNGNLVPTDRQYDFMLRLQDPLGNVWQKAVPVTSTDIRVLSRRADGVLVKIVLILFEFGRSELRPEMKTKLDKVAELIKTYPRTQTKVLVEGHTDEVGSDGFNQWLSEQRAQNVLNYLQTIDQVPGDMIAFKGYGKAHPMVQGTNEQDRARNRRVEITLLLPLQ